MSVVSDSIEAFIISMLEEQGAAELRRNELAQYFGCAPSQINYVLSTRFSVERGYLIRSKRGGGGYIAIERIPANAESLQVMVIEQLSERLSRAQALAMLENLARNGVINGREAAIMSAATDKFPMVQREAQDFLRAQCMKSMLEAIMRNNCEKN